jgi:hypothetical protein
MSEFYEELAQFFKDCGRQEVPDVYLERIMKRVTSAPQYVEDTNVKFRASKIGRPFILQLVERWYGGRRPTTAANALAMLSGNMVQEVAAELMELAHLNFKQELRLEHLGIAGHADFLVWQGEDALLIECKSMAPHIYQRFKTEPTDDYGYLSQLAFYTDCVRRTENKNVVPAFLLFNRGTSEFHLMRIANHVIENRVERYTKAVPGLLEVTDYDMLGALQVVQPPPALGGKMPTSISNTKWANYFYENRDGYWWVRGQEDIIQRFSQLTSQRADREPLRYRGPDNV